MGRRRLPPRPRWHRARDRAVAGVRERAGRRRAVRNLVDRGIDRLVVIGGDGGIDRATADRHPALAITGLVGSIDNDVVGTETTIGADSALHRIVEALDAISSTASSHQRSFVVEVMGRRCGYLALAGAPAGGAHYVFVPERPPSPQWATDLCALVRADRAAGCRNNVVVAEGAHDSENTPITGDDVRAVLEEELGEDTRVTVLGHVQRGGAPSAYDRWMSSILGCAAVEELLTATPDRTPRLIGVRGNAVHTVPLHEAVARTHELADRIAARDFTAAQEMRGEGFIELAGLFESLSRALPSTPAPSTTVPRRIAVLNVGGLAPGMNAAARAAVRLGLHRGHTMLGIDGSFRGLVDGDVRELGWGDVSGWTAEGGARLGISRHVPSVEDLYAIGRGLEEHRVDGLLLFGGWDAFAAGGTMLAERHRYPAFQIPVIVLPATIDNNIPGTAMTVGADTALNHIVGSVDRIRHTSAAARRCFVVEIMGGYCGYLALMGGISGGAVRVHLHEEGVTLAQLADDVSRMVESFAAGQRLFLTVRNEHSNAMYTSDFLRRLFEQEGRRVFDARQIVLGQTQQGGSPTPYDRVLVARFAARCVEWLGEQLDSGRSGCAVIGLHEGDVRILPMRRAEELADRTHRRPVDQWWMRLRPTIEMLAGRLPTPERREQPADRAARQPSRASAVPRVSRPGRRRPGTAGCPAPAG
ncbi:MAG: 6-phosphofructokinase 1 [Pseudonocardiales bacterium]|nr:6-phosphofructokinase 1 [Pseudonocardiales bacterium]